MPDRQMYIIKKQQQGEKVKTNIELAKFENHQAPICNI